MTYVNPQFLSCGSSYFRFRFLRLLENLTESAQFNFKTTVQFKTNEGKLTYGTCYFTDNLYTMY